MDNFTCAFDNWLYPALSFSVIYLTVGNMYAILDFLQPSWYKRRAVHTRSFELGFISWYNLMRINMRNIIVGGIITFFMWYLRIFLIGCPAVRYDMGKTELKELLLCKIFAQSWFFLTHYTFHKIPWLYLKIHSFHHIFKTPIALSGLYANIWEIIIVNIPTAFFMPIYLGISPVIASIWVGLLAVHLCITHSSHRLFPWVEDPVYHMQHHLHADRHFGAVGTEMIEELLERIVK